MSKSATQVFPAVRAKGKLVARALSEEAVGSCRRRMPEPRSGVVDCSLKKMMSPVIPPREKWNVNVVSELSVKVRQPRLSGPTE